MQVRWPGNCVGGRKGGQAASGATAAARWVECPRIGLGRAKYAADPPFSQGRRCLALLLRFSLCRNGPGVTG